MTKAKLADALKNRIDAGEKLFSPFIMAGDGGLDILPERIAFFERAGAAVIELGIPFSDPVADGPTIQRAGIRALENGTTLAKVFTILEENKAERNIPIVIMTYYNPILAVGLDAFAEKCKQAGVSGVIIPDLPMEEETPVATSLTKQEIAFIRLAAMTSPEERLREIAARSEGFLYAVAVTGTTGERTEHDEYVKTYLEQLKSYSNVPVLAGFGVSTSEQARELSKYCDGVIVGSKIVESLHKGEITEIETLIKESRMVNV